MPPLATYNAGNMMARKVFQRAFTAAVLVLLVAFPALAGDGFEGKAPQLEPSPPWVAIVYSVVGLAGVAVVAFKNAKRTHLD
jgi:hypothetical protein